MHHSTFFPVDPSVPQRTPAALSSDRKAFKFRMRRSRLKAFMNLKALVSPLKIVTKKKMLKLPSSLKLQHFIKWLLTPFFKHHFFVLLITVL